METQGAATANRSAIVWTLAIATLAVLVTTVPARAGGYYRRGTFVMAGGFNVPTGDMAKYLDSGGTLMIGGGRHINKFWTAEVDWTHNWLGVDPAVYDHVNTDSVSFSNLYASN